MPRNDYLSSDSSGSEREYKKCKSKKRKEKADSDHEKIRKNKRHKTRSRSPEYHRRRSRNEVKYDEEISKKRERKEKSIERHHVKSKDTDKNISKGERRDRRSRSRSREEKSSREGTKKSKNKHKHDKKRERSPSSEKRTDRERDVTRKHEKGNTSSSSDRQNSYKKRNTDKDDASPVHKKIDKAGRSESVNKDDNTKSKSKKKDKVRNKSESSSKKDKNKDKYIEKSSRRSRRESTEDPDINKDFEELSDRKVVDYGDYEYNSPQSKKRDVGSEGEGSNEESEIKKHSKSKSGIKSSEKSNSMKNGENQGKEVNDNKKSSKGQSNLALKKVVVDPVSMRTGGAYIPPARLKMMQDNITDKSSDTFQRLAWEALKKSINGIINKLNVGNIGILIKELFQENLVRGRGILCRSLIQAQAFSPTFTHVYAALVCVLNSKFPQIGELLLHRLIIQFRRGIKRNDKNICMASCKFLAHLVNVQVVHEILALEMLTLLLEKAKDVEDSELAVKSRESSIELTIAFLKESGNKLQELTPKGLHIIIQTLRNILHEGKLEARFKYMIEVLLKDTKTNFSEYPAVIEELDIVEESEKYTHIIELDGKLNGEEILNVFKSDPNYIENENKYKELKDGILRDSDDSDSGSDDSDDSDSGDSSEEGEGEAAQDKSSEPILDKTETNLTSFRRVVYLTIQSSLDVDECAHKLLKGEIKPGWEEELCNMIVDCCAQQRTYIKFYGLLAARFCQLNRVYQECFETTFVAAYKTCHRLETEKLRNVTKLYSHLLYTDAISWQVMECIRLNMDESTSSSRVFIKIMFEELANFMGLAKLNERLHEPTLASAFEGLLPKDNPVNTRFAINFFTTIGLGGLTDGLRDFLRSQPKPTAVVAPVQKKTKSSSEDSSSSSSSSSSDSSSSSSSDSSSSDSDSDSSSSSSDSSDSSSDSSDSSDSDSSSSSESEKERKSSRKKKTKKVQKKPVAVASGRKSSKKKSKPSKEVNKSSKRVSNGKRRT